MTATRTPTGLDALQYVNGDIVSDVFYRHAAEAVRVAVNGVGADIDDQFTKDLMVEAAIEAVIKFVASFSDTFDPADESVTVAEACREELLCQLREEIN